MHRRASVFNRMSDAQVAKYQQVFNRFDTDGNGHIDEYELHSIMMKLGRPLEDGESKKLIDTVDTDGSGVVYFDEFLNLLEMEEAHQHKLEFNKDVFRTVFNKSGSGYMTREELRIGMLTLGLQMSDEQIDEMLSIGDVNRDGRISFEEFHAMHNTSMSGRRVSSVIAACWDRVFEEAPKVAEKFHMVNKCAKPMRDYRHSSRTLTHKVRQLPSDNPKSLPPAVDSCGQHDVIEVETGVFTEPIVLNIEGVYLVGGKQFAGEGELNSSVDSSATTVARTRIEVNSNHPAVTIRAKRCFIENFEIINHGTGPAVMVDGGYPDITNCIISGQHGGLMVKGRSHPLIKKCTMHDSGRAWGMLIRESKAIIEDCHFTGNSDGGLVVERSSSPWIHNCTFTKGKGCGMVLDDTASGVVMGCEISQNGCSGVLLTNGANPIFWKNNIHSGDAHGVSIQKGGRGHFEANQIYGNEGSEVEITTAANPLIRKNTISDSHGSGIFIDDGSHGIIEENQISNCRLAGISIMRASPIVTENIIHAPEEIGGTCAVSIGEDSAGRITENMFVGWNGGGGDRRPSRASLSNGLSIHIGGKHTAEISGNIARQTEDECRAEKMVHMMGKYRLKRRS